MTREGLTWPQMQFLKKIILLFIVYLVTQFLFKSSDFDMNVP